MNKFKNSFVVSFTVASLLAGLFFLFAWKDKSSDAHTLSLLGAVGLMIFFEIPLAVNDALGFKLPMSLFVLFAIFIDGFVFGGLAALVWRGIKKRNDEA